MFSKYQPPLNLRLGDGGNFDNTGLLALLQRGVKRCIAFINTSTPLTKVTEENKFHDNGNPCATQDLLGLFGAVNDISTEGNYADNKVFDKDELNDVMRGLIEGKEGNGAVYKKELTVRHNDVWNIPGGWKVEVVFIYNEECKSFQDNLPDDTKAAIKKATGELRNFPRYQLLFQSTQSLGYTPEEINLLAAQGEFIIHQNIDVISSLFN